MTFILYVIYVAILYYSRDDIAIAANKITIEQLNEKKKYLLV